MTWTPPEPAIVNTEECELYYTLDQPCEPVNPSVVVNTNRHKGTAMSRLLELADAYAMVVYQTKNPDSEEADAARAALVAEIERVEKDAARWRFARENNCVSKNEEEGVSWVGIGIFDEFGCVSISGEEADKTVDAAIDAMKEQTL